MSRRAVLAGATGLIGQQLLPLLLSHAEYEHVTVLSRRPLPGVPGSSRLTVLVTDFSDLARHAEALDADDVFCCLGTTMAKAGSKDAFAQVDYGHVVDLAQAAKAAGSHQFLVVSSVGSATDSSSFYIRTKARMEQALRMLGFESLHILRPSLLLGQRAESRPAERMAQGVLPLLAPLLRGRWQRYRPVAAADVARAMLVYAQRRQRGVHVHEAPFAG